MKAILITFDSLNRRMLPNYGNEQVVAPGFERLGNHCTRFDACYAGSLPCIPARRELHTGRENFLHCRWAALEPFDDSMPEILKRHGIYAHLVTDHTHYWEDEGFGYHTKYNSFRFSRGQEGDPVYGSVDPGEIEKTVRGRRVPQLRVQDAVNRRHLNQKEDYPQAVTFQWGLDFIEENHQAENWFLHIESFDPHEPFTAPESFRALYNLPVSEGQESDWPDYRQSEGIPEEKLEQYRKENMALVSFCSYNLERLLDAMDQYNLWEDTLLIVHTDHGFLLGEHGWLGKNTGPYYNEVARIPLFIYDPRDKNLQSVSQELVQTVDLPATILDYFGLTIPPNMTGRPIRGGKRSEKRETAAFGLFGGQINLTDGRYVYMRAPRKKGSPYAYTMSGFHFMRRRIQEGAVPYELSMGRAFCFSKGYPLFRIGNMGNDFQTMQAELGDQLFDLQEDPGQNRPISLPAVEEKMEKSLRAWMESMDAPEELYEYYGL